MYYIEFSGKFFAGLNVYSEPVFHSGIKKAFFRKDDAEKVLIYIDDKLKSKMKNWQYHKKFLRIVNSERLKAWQSLNVKRKN